MHLLSKTVEQVNDFIALSLLSSSALLSSVENGTVDDTPAAEPEDMASQASAGAEREGGEEDLMQFEPTQEELERERLTVRAEQVSSFGTILSCWLCLFSF